MGSEYLLNLPLASMAFVMQIGLVVQKLGDLLQVIASILAQTAFLGKQKKKLLFLDPVQKLNTEH